MAKKSKGELKVDFTSFMPILILTIGSLLTLLVTNTVIIMSNPENIRIISVVRSALYLEGGEGMEGGSPFPYGNEDREPAYVDVHRDHIIVYPGDAIVPVRDLEMAGNAFERLLDDVEPTKEFENTKDQKYVILLVRPRAAQVARRLKKAVRDRGINLGYELFEEGRDVDYERHRAAVKKE